MRLHGYFRSTASWRVRIALNLKGVEAEHEAHHLRHGAQRAADYLRLNPQGLVPTLELDDGTPLTQSLAICEWLEETRPDPPLLPGGALERAKIRAFAFAIACDVHPVQNLRVLERLRAMKISEDDVTAWARSVIADGLEACQKLIAPTHGAVLLRRTPHARRRLSRPATLQRPPLRRRPRGLRPAADGRGRLRKTSRLRRRGARTPARRRIDPLIERSYP